MDATGACQPKILVVDDDALHREVLLQWLRMAGYEAIAADTGERALALLRAWPRSIEWLYTAVKLPGLVDGYIVADEFASLRPTRPVVYAANHAACDTPDGSDVVLARGSPPNVVVACFHRLTGLGVTRHLTRPLTPAPLDGACPAPLNGAADPLPASRGEVRRARRRAG